jgi:hypothetical protein
MDYISILSAITAYIDIPAIILGMMLAAAWFMIRSAQKRDDFDFGNMLKDDGGKESATRMGILVAMCFSSWSLMYDTIHNKQVDPTVILIYLCVWSGTKVAEKLVDALVAKWTR